MFIHFISDNSILIAVCPLEMFQDIDDDNLLSTLQAGIDCEELSQYIAEQNILYDTYVTEIEVHLSDETFKPSEERRFWGLIITMDVDDYLHLKLAFG